jgi:hypothetical protein
MIMITVCLNFATDPLFKFLRIASAGDIFACQNPNLQSSFSLLIGRQELYLCLACPEQAISKCEQQLVSWNNWNFQSV